MGVDRYLNQAREGIDNAIYALTQIVTDRDCDGIEDYPKDTQLKWCDQLNALIKMRINLDKH